MVRGRIKEKPLKIIKGFLLSLVHQTRFELARVASHAPQACASTDSATGAQ